MQLKILFLGTPEFAVLSLKALSAVPDFKPVGVITQPDRPAGRGLKLVPPPVKSLAVSEEIPCLQPRRVRGDAAVEQFLERCVPDLAVVVAFGQILPREFFEYPRWGTINVHASLLPKYRGAAPVVHSILNGEDQTGVTIMQIEEELDAGDILSARSVSLGKNTTGGELESQLAVAGAELLVETIPPYVQGMIRPRPQDESLATYAPRIGREQARIDWSRPVPQIHNLIRALNPRPGSYTKFRGQYLKIWRSEEVAESAVEKSDLSPGAVVRAKGDRILVCCGSGSALSLLELQLAGRKRSSAQDFVNGVGLRVGEVFG